MAPIYIWHNQKWVFTCYFVQSGLGRVVLTTNIKRVALFELLLEQALRAMIVLPLLYGAALIVPFEGVKNLHERATIMAIEAAFTIIAAYGIASLLTPIVSSWCLKRRHPFPRKHILSEKRMLAHDLWRARSGVVVWVIVSTAVILFYSTGSILFGSVLLLGTVMVDQGVTIWGVKTTLLP